MYCDPVDLYICREDRGVKSSHEEGLSQGAVELRLKGVSGIGRGGEGVQECSVFWAKVEGQEMSRAVMPRAATSGQCGRVPTMVTGEKVSLGIPAVWGLSQEEHLVDLRLEKEGDRGVDPKEIEYACQAVFNLHCSLPVAVNKVLDSVRCDEVCCRVVGNMLAAGDCVSVRYVRKLFVRVCLEELFSVLYAGNVGEALVWGGGSRGGDHMHMFVVRRGGALGASVRSWRR